MASDRETLNMIRELLDLEEGLSEWEVEFLESNSRRTSFTEKQSQKVEEIWDDRIGNKQ